MNDSFELISEKALKYRRDILGFKDEEVIKEYTKPAENAGFCLFVLPLGKIYKSDQEKGFLLRAMRRLEIVSATTFQTVV